MSGSGAGSLNPQDAMREDWIRSPLMTHFAFSLFCQKNSSNLVLPLNMHRGASLYTHQTNQQTLFYYRLKPVRLNEVGKELLLCQHGQERHVYGLLPVTWAAFVATHIRCISRPRVLVTASLHIRAVDVDPDVDLQQVIKALDEEAKKGCMNAAQVFLGLGQGCG